MSLWPEAKGASLALSQWLCRRRTTLKRGGFAVNYPLSKKEQKKRIDHDPRLGWPGSTFSNQITLSRHYAFGTNASNYYYNARGVFPRLDDGRLIRDAYDRRERPGKKRRGPESPADWRRVPRRRPAAAA